MRRFICWVTGHRWKVLAEQPRWHLWMMHMNPGIGQIRECLRCGKVYDFTNPRTELWGPVLRSDAEICAWWARLEGCEETHDV